MRTNARCRSSGAMAFLAGSACCTVVSLGPKEVEAAVDGYAGLLAFIGGIGIHSAQNVDKTESGDDRQSGAEQDAIAKEPAQNNFIFFHRLGDDRVDRLVLDVVGDAE